MAEDIFREVDGDLQAERLRSLARRYAGAGLAVVVAALAAGGGWMWHESRVNQEATAGSAVLFKAMRDSASPIQPGAQALALNDAQKKALAELAPLEKTAPAGISAMARFQDAQLQATHGNLTAALAKWDAIAGDEHVDPLLRDLATLFWCQRQIDNGDPATLRSRLALLSSKSEAGSHPWGPLASEAIAMLDLRENHLEEARKRLTTLSHSPDSPQGVRMRANALLQTIDQKAG